jgi:hypothetical protein
VYRCVRHLLYLFLTQLESGSVLDTASLPQTLLIIILLNAAAEGLLFIFFLHAHVVELHLVNILSLEWLIALLNIILDFAYTLE